MRHCPQYQPSLGLEPADLADLEGLANTPRHRLDRGLSLDRAQRPSLSPQASTGRFRGPRTWPNRRPGSRIGGLCIAQHAKPLSVLDYSGLSAGAQQLHSHRHGLFPLIYQRLVWRSPCVMCGYFFSAGEGSVPLLGLFGFGAPAK